MIKQEQQYPHAPDKGIYGDCMRASLASLLDMEVEDVPHFLYDNCDNNEYHRRISAFLAPKGLMLMCHNSFDLLKHKALLSYEASIYHIISDESPRFAGAFHATVGDSGEIIHDPHPDKQGLPKETDDRAYEFLIVADMTKLSYWIVNKKHLQTDRKESE